MTNFVKKMRNIVYFGNCCQNVDLVLNWLNCWDCLKCENYVILLNELDIKVCMYIYIYSSCGIVLKRGLEILITMVYCVEQLNMEVMLHCIIKHTLAFQFIRLCYALEICIEKRMLGNGFSWNGFRVNTMVSLDRWCRWNCLSWPECPRWKTRKLHG